MEQKNHEKFLIYGVYSKLLNGGRYHGILQTSCRIMASSWLLATFVAIGFLLSKDNVLPFNHILAVPIPCIIGILSIYLLWYEDTFIQEILLDINVIHALELEKKHSWLPQVHHRFLHLYKDTNARFVKVLFFIGCKSVLFLIMGGSFFIYFFKENLTTSLVLAATCLVLNFLSSRYMSKKAGRIQDLIKALNERR